MRERGTAAGFGARTRVTMQATSVISRFMFEIRRVEDLRAAGHFVEALELSHRLATDFEDLFVRSAQRLGNVDEENLTAGLEVLGLLEGRVLVDLGDFRRAIPLLDRAARQLDGDPDRNP